ncbi:hypothetical protein HNR12_004020 [Streptomonospora nanhaiensis]|uniref:Glycosyltransferase RgtA/B/C/D-like domain-containing protein n=1 Tax=Streptomonospora nanhaiensis TaxID=1323731 RepID=A0A853BRG6_9ACTN|nr:hypothetical protein [Streptomonospora nanhaiensis]NYI97743.1 hypothetical protein [Streptomonospora nanhaiensis]
MGSTSARMFTRVTAAPAIAISAWLLVAFPLLVAGVLTPLAGGLLGVPAVALGLLAAARLVPPAPGAEAGEDVPWWPLVLTVLIGVAFTAVQIAYHSEILVIRRDPASYAQFTFWIAEHGSLPIPQRRDLIAGDDPALVYDSLAYYEVGEVVWPQFLAGAPLVYTVGHWLGGMTGMLVTPPVVGGLGVVTFGGLAGRLVGVRWAPLAALVLAVCQTQQWVSRSTYSEPVAQVLLLGALALAFDALTRRTALGGRWGRAHALAGGAGLVFGLGLVVRIDALRDLLPLVGFVGLLLLARRGQALPLLAGLVLGAGYGFTAGYGLSRPYLEHLSDSLNPLLLISAGVVAAVALAVALLWRRGVPRTDRPRWLPAAGAAAVVVVMAVLALRPLVYTDYGHGAAATAMYIGQVQAFEGLPNDPDRTYYELSLYWVGWYVGLSTVLLATFGAAVLAHRILRRREPQWVLPALVLGWTVVTTLLRPAITPDHPWASRRLIVLVIPAFILFAVWFTAWLTRRLATEPAVDRRAVRTAAAGAAAVVGAAVMLVPTAITAWGVMTYRSDVGSVAAAQRLCRAIPDDASVLIVDSAYANFMQLVRGMCGVPTAALSSAVPQADAARVVEEIRERGRTPVLAAGAPEDLRPLVPEGATMTRPFDVHTEQDPSTLMEPPAGPWIFDDELWVAVVR